jgi:hypothetical protein
MASGGEGREAFTVGRPDSKSVARGDAVGRRVPQRELGPRGFAPGRASPCLEPERVSEPSADGRLSQPKGAEGRDRGLPRSSPPPTGKLVR